MADKSRTLLVRFAGDYRDLDKATDGVHTKLSGLGKALGALGGIAAAAVGVDFLKDSLNEARESIKVGKQTEAVLQSTGGAAKVTAADIGKLATALSNKAGVDDEVIQSGANVLLTFTKVRNEVGQGNDIFDQATASALDMSSALGMDLQSSVTMVGKALNDPIKGMAAMSKAGIQFTQQQKDEIKTLVEKGDVLGAQKIILGELKTQFGGMAEASADSGQKFSVAMGNLKEAIGTALMPIFEKLASFATEKLIPGLAVAVDFFQSSFIPALGSVRDWIRDKLWPVLVGIWSAVAPVIMPVVQVIRDVAVGAFQWLLEKLSAVWSFITANIGPAIQSFTQWLRDNQLVVAMLAGMLGAMVVRLVVAEGIILAIRTATMVWAAAQWLLNAALTANPIGLVVMAIGALVGGLIYAWTHFEGFRRVVITVWEALKTGAAAVWSALQAAWNGIVAGIKWVGEIATWLWSNVLEPVFSFISLAARILAAILITVLVMPTVLAFQLLAAIATWLWTSVIQPVFSAIGALATWLWTNAIQPAFAGIGAAAMWMWTNAIKPAIDFIVGAFQFYASIAVWLWQSVIQPTFAAIGAVIVWLWTNIVLPYFELIKGALSILGAAFTWIYQNVIKPAFDAIGSVISWTWSNIISPAFEALKSGVDAVGRVFESVAGWIGRTWNSIKDAALAPVQFVVDVVYNNGIRKVWNGIAGLFGLGQLPEVNLSSVNVRGGAMKAMASGGEVSGPGGPRDDKVLTWLSNGEYVVNARDTRRNLSLLEAINGGGIPGFADGGIVGWATDQFAGVSNGLSNFGGHPWIQALAAIPREAIKGVIEKVKNSMATATTSFTGGAGVERWSPLVLQVLAMLGQPASLLPSVLRRMNQESGGNPMAINNWDSNAAAGIPSKGLMQTIDPTFNAYAGPFRSRGVWDPLANIYAGLNYAKSRYGSIQSAMDRPGGYDSGGWMNPGQSGVNGLRRPEAVLTPVESAAFVALAKDAASGNGGVHKHYHLTVHTSQSELSVRDQFDRMEMLEPE